MKKRYNTKSLLEIKLNNNDNNFASKYSIKISNTDNKEWSEAYSIKIFFMKM